MAPNAAMKNAAGNFVQPNLKTIQAAANSADWANSKDFYLIVTNAPGAESWPITAATFVLMHKDPADKAASAEALKFFDWAFANGNKMAEELDYIPMPASVVTLIKATWAKDIKNK